LLGQFGLFVCIPFFSWIDSFPCPWVALLC
jgi:hypothetical protein